MAYHHLIAKHCLKFLHFLPNLRLETCQHMAIKVQQRALYMCCECLSPCYASPYNGIWPIYKHVGDAIPPLHILPHGSVISLLQDAGYFLTDFDRYHT